MSYKPFTGSSWSTLSSDYDSAPQPEWSTSQPGRSQPSDASASGAATSSSFSFSYSANSNQYQSQSRDYPANSQHHNQPLSSYGAPSYPSYPSSSTAHRSSPLSSSSPTGPAGVERSYSDVPAYAPPVHRRRSESPVEQRYEADYSYSAMSSSRSSSTAASATSGYSRSAPTYQPASPSSPMPRYDAAAAAHASGGQTGAGSSLSYTPAQPPPTSPTPKTPAAATTSSANMAATLKIQQRLQAISDKTPRGSSGLPSVTQEVIAQLASCLADETVFEIFREIEEIQLITERNLLNERMRVLNQHKTRRIDLAKEHKAALQKYETMAHRLPQIKSNFQQKKTALEKTLEEELRQLDQKIILQLDQQVLEQQSTLQQVGVPCFYITNNKEELRLQMAIMRLIRSVRDKPPPAASR
eukprot:scpid48340/ scgid17291/ Protein DGCR6L; DiGeorge syndrome critical region 6-like protein